MTKDVKNDNQEKIVKKKEEFLNELKSDELEILDGTAGGMKESSIGRVDDNNWCDQGC